MDSRLFLIINNQQLYDCCGLIGVSGLNATDKTPMNDMLMIYMVGVWDWR